MIETSGQDERVEAVAAALCRKWNLWPADARRIATDAVRALDAHDFGEETPWGAVKAVRRARAEREGR